MAAQIGADPGQVIDMMANRIGTLVKDLTVAQCIIQQQQEEIDRLRAQPADPPPTV